MQFILNFFPGSASSFWERSLRRLSEWAGELEAERDRDLRGANPKCRSVASTLHLPLLREAIAGSGEGGGSWVDLFGSGFPLIGAISEGGVSRALG